MNFLSPWYKAFLFYNQLIIAWLQADLRKAAIFSGCCLISFGSGNHRNNSYFDFFQWIALGINYLSL